MTKRTNSSDNFMLWIVIALIFVFMWFVLATSVPASGACVDNQTIPAYPAPDDCQPVPTAMPTRSGSLPPPVFLPVSYNAPTEEALMEWRKIDMPMRVK